MIRDDHQEPGGRLKRSEEDEEGGAEPKAEPKAGPEAERGAGDLVDHSPPPPDSPVVRLADESDRRHRDWFIAVFLVVLLAVILAGLVGPAYLSEQQWARMQPELASMRFWVFQIGVLIGGYLFFTKPDR